MELKTSLMVSEIKLNIATNGKDLKLDTNDLKSNLKSDIATNVDEINALTRPG